MKVSEIYNLAIRMGMEADPRGRKFVQGELREAKKAYGQGDNQWAAELCTRGCSTARGTGRSREYWWAST